MSSLTRSRGRRRPIFAFAGIWRPVGDDAAYAFLTTGYDGDPAAHVVGAVHPKAMPVIVDDDDYERWLTAPVEDGLGWLSRSHRSL